MPAHKKQRLGIYKLIGTISGKDLERVCQQVRPDLGVDLLRVKTRFGQQGLQFDPLIKAQRTVFAGPVLLYLARAADAVGQMAQRARPAGLSGLEVLSDLASWLPLYIFHLAIVL